jgi:hypothetical protein
VAATGERRPADRGAVRAGVPGRGAALTPGSHSGG